MSVLSGLLGDLFSRNSPLGASHHSSAISSTEKLVEFGCEMLTAGDISGAESMCVKALALVPEHESACQLQIDIEFVQCLAAVDQRFPGPRYLDWLAWFHQTLAPESYLEIGVESGQSLQFAAAPTRTVGVDPDIRIVYPQKNWVKLFKLTSDDFFATQDIRQVFGVETIRLSFIDGLHTFDQALRDFINVERFSNAASVVLFHDIFPVVPATAQRDRITKFWVGDTWKVMWILLKYRPELNIFTIPSGPSGLGVVTGLNPNSDILQSEFDRICREAMILDLDTFIADMGTLLHVVENDFEGVANRFNNMK